MKNKEICNRTFEKGSYGFTDSRCPDCGFLCINHDYPNSNMFKVEVLEPRRQGKLYDVKGIKESDTKLKGLISDGYNQCKKDILQKVMQLPAVETYQGKHVIHREMVEELLKD